MELRGVFDAFYDRLVLRDLFGKVVPGILLIGSIFSSFYGLDKLEHLVDKMPVVLWLVAAGFSWLTGFVLQYVGEGCRLLKTHPPGREGQETRDTFYSKWARFHEVAASHERIHAERLIVIKEACGNASVSLCLAVAFALIGFAIKGSLSWYPSGALMLILLGMAVAFWRMHVIHVHRYGQFVTSTNSHHGTTSLTIQT